MTVYEIPNIEHCTVTEVGDPVAMYRIKSSDGWYIHLNTADTENIYKTFVALLATYDFSLVQIVAEADLPEGAEILANDNTVTE